MWVYILALLAALFVGGASVIQQRAASQAPPEHNLSPKLLVWLAQRPLWLSGVACSVIGNLIFAAAVGRGSVALAEALLVVRLLFALPLAAAWGRHTVPGRDWGGAVAITAGLIGFILAFRPQEGEEVEVANVTWILGGGTVVAVVLALVVAARSMRSPTRKAPLLGAGAAALFGLQASLTRSAIHVIQESGFVGLLTTWQGYCVVACAVTGMLLVQSAYELAPLPASYPAVVTTELLVGIAVGVAVLGGTVRLGPIALVAGLICLIVMIGGIYILTTSPLVTGELDRLERRQEEGQARITEEELERDLRRASRDLNEFEAYLRSPRERRRTRRQLQRHLERDLSRIHREIDRLDELQRDIRRHREAEKEHLRDVPERERYRIAEDYESLPAWEREIDARADRLRAHAAEIEERVRAIESERFGPET